MNAVHLANLGVDVLIVDKQPRVGDAWRTRYEALVLHMPRGMMHFPFMKFPDNFPDYIPKDKLAEWFESYVSAMDLNFWTSTEFLGGTYDEAERRWEVQIRRDGEVR